MAVSVAENLMVYEKPKDGDQEIKVEDYAYLVKRIAHHMMARMPSCVQIEDLIQAGMLGLLEAAQKYDASKGASFETYSGIRIRGAIVRVAEAIATVEARHGRDARDHEIAEEMDLSLDEYYAMARDSASTRLFSYEETYENDESRFDEYEPSDGLRGPSEQVHRNALYTDLVAAIGKLPERERLVLSLYYEQEMNLKEIGLVLGVSESRVSQIHSQAALRLKSRMQDWQSYE